jgi:peptidoglycan-N-acetylglucosamine deacetylase
VTKREVIVRFVVLATLLVVAGTAGGWLVHREVDSWFGWAVMALSVVIVGLLAWACFTPNSRLFGPVITGKGVRRKLLAITFDDGPSPDVTPRILDALREREARATFFVLGKHAERHPELVERMRNEGHEVASHGLDHSLLTFAGTAEVGRQLDDTERILTANGTEPSRLFRAPHGFRNPLVGIAAASRGYRVVGWTKGVWDTARPGVETIVERSQRGFEPGGILLLHDADGSGHGGDRSQTAEAVPQILEAATAEGYSLVTVSELASESPSRKWAMVRILIGAAVAVGAVTFGLKKLHLGVVENGVDIHWWWVLAALVANFLSILAKATTWKAALDSAREKSSVRYRDVIPALFIGFLLNTVLFARVGEVARVAVLQRRLKNRGDDMSVVVIAGTVVAEQVALGASLALLLVAMAIILPVPSLAKRLVAAFVAALFLIGLVLVGLEAFTRYRRRQHRSERDYAQAWWHAARIQLESFAHGIVRGQQMWRNRRAAALAGVSGFASWVAQILGIYWALRAFGIGIHHGMAAAALVFFASTLAQLFPILPGNLGVFQGAVALPLTTTYGIDASRAVQFAFGLQLIEAVLGVGLGFWFLWREGLSLAEARGLRGTDDDNGSDPPGAPPERAPVPAGSER